MSSKRLVMLLGLAGFIVMADNWVVSPILPAIAKSMGVHPAAAGVLIASYMLPFGVFQLVFGPLSDRLGKSRVILVTLVLFSIATALCATGATLTGLAVYRALTGVFAAATMPISLALIGDVVPMQQRQQAIGTFMGISFLGQALSMGIGGAIAYFLDWRGVFAIYAGVSAIIVVVLWRTLRAAVGDHETRNAHAPILQPYAALLGTGASLRTYVLVLFEGAFLLGSFSYLGAVLSERFHLTFAAIGAVMTAFGVGAIIGGRISSGISERIGRPATVTTGLLLAAMGDFFVLEGSHSLVATGIGVFLLGLGTMTAHSTLLTIATQFAEKARGTAMSLVAFAFMGGGALGTQLGGRLIAHSGFSAMYEVYAVGLVAVATAALPALRAADVALRTSMRLEE